MTSPTVPATPVLGHVEGVELVDTGTWAASTGPFTATPEHLAAAIAALDCPAVRRPVLKAGHGGQHGVGEPALGYVANLRTANEGHTLVGDYRGMPGWLTDTDEDGQSVLASAYPDRSIEGEFDYRCQLGHTHPFVVHAVAILGVERPAVGTLQSLQELYGVVAATEPSPGGTSFAVLVTAAQEAPVPQPISAAATTDDVRRAFYATPAGASWDVWIREMYVDPPELIVDNDADSSITRVPYTVAGDGTVTFGEPQLVKVQYVAARAQAGQPAVAYASKAESRPARPAPAATAPPDTPPAAAGEGHDAPAGASTEEEGTMPDTTLRDLLRPHLGFAEDADDQTIAAAVAEALAEQADPPAAPAGTVLVEADQWQATVAAAEAGRQAREEQLAARREQLVDAAIRDGRISPARRDAWLTSLTADPGSETVLAGLAKGTVPLVSLGHADGADLTDDDATYQALYGAEKGA